MPPIDSIDDIYKLTKEQNQFLNYMFDYQRELLPVTAVEAIESAVQIGLYDKSEREILNSVGRIYKINLISGTIGEMTYEWYKRNLFKL